MGRGDTATKYHEKLARAMAPHKGETFEAKKVKEIYDKTYPDEDNGVRYVQPSDHAVNWGNNGPCRCAETAGAIFKRIAHNAWQVL